MAVLLLSFFALMHAQEITFTNVAGEMGIEHTYVHSGVWGGGMAFLDFNGDGMDDLTMASGVGETIYVYRNDVSNFTDIASELALNDAAESQSVLWIDYDNDGLRDLFISNFEAGIRLYRQYLPLMIEDVTESSGLETEPLPFSAAAWADYDNDGLVDLYLTNRDPSQLNRLFRNNGDGTFDDVSESANAGDPGQAPLAVSFLDYDNDGWQDIYLANDRGVFLGGNTLLRNNGDGTFNDVSESSGADLRYDGMGIAVGDYNEDGFVDIYASNGDAGNGLLHNNGDGTFTEISEELGIQVNRTCWGVNFLDFDNDMDLDLYVCVSAGTDTSNVLFENTGDGGFMLASDRILDADSYESFGVVSGDYDGNGYPDMAVLNQAANSCLWRNSGGTNSWIKLRLQGTTVNRDAIGSRIYVHAGRRRLLRTTHAGISYLGQNSQVEMIGLETAAMVDSIIIHWPGGGVERHNNLDVNQLHTIIEGEGVLGVNADNPASPDDFHLAQNYPNPFNPVTNVEFGMRLPAGQAGSAEWVRLEIFDVSGRHVKTLVDRRMGPGYHRVTWDGTNARGAQVAGGLYFYRLRGESFAKVRKMLKTP